MSDAQLTDVARYRVMFADCDPTGLMYFGRYPRLLEMGRAELFRRLGHPFPDYIARGLYLAVVEVHCRYRQPARYDDELAIAAGVTDVRRARLTIAYEVKGPDGAVVATAMTVHAVLDESGRPQRIPAEFREAALENVTRQA